MEILWTQVLKSPPTTESGEGVPRVLVVVETFEDIEIDILGLINIEGFDHREQFVTSLQFLVQVIESINLRQEFHDTSSDTVAQHIV